MKQLTHIPISRHRVEEILFRSAPAPFYPRIPEDGQSWPCAPAARVRIYDMEREWSHPYWLCAAGVRTMQGDRWRVRSHRAPPFETLQCYVHRDGPCPE